jgi:hypothetical protein
VSEAGIYCHHKNLIQIRQDFFQYEGRGCRINGHTHLFPQGPYALHSPMQIVVAFPMHDKRIRASFDKLIEKRVRGQ